MTLPGSPARERCRLDHPQPGRVRREDRQQSCAAWVTVGVKAVPEAGQRLASGQACAESADRIADDVRVGRQGTNLVGHAAVSGTGKG